MEKHYIVDALCGHVGLNNNIIISFTVCANNAKIAAKMTRQFPRVKHHCKNAILGVKEVSYTHYKKQQKINNNDPYLKCKNTQDQKKILDKIQ